MQDRYHPKKEPRRKVETTILFSTTKIHIPVLMERFSFSQKSCKANCVSWLFVNLVAQRETVLLGGRIKVLSILEEYRKGQCSGAITGINATVISRSALLPTYQRISRASTLETTRIPSILHAKIVSYPITS